MAGINRAYQVTNEAYAFNKSVSHQSIDKPCIFLSHISIDKPAAVSIGEYITSRADIDIYLDIYDDELQLAVQNNDATAITQKIERGISASSHAMCLISENTKSSWWVPYELGFAKKSNKQLSSLMLKNVNEIPAFLQISTIIKGTRTLNAYLDDVIYKFTTSQRAVALNKSLISESSANHPLDNYLNWNL